MDLGLEQRRYTRNLQIECTAISGRTSTKPVLIRLSFVYIPPRNVQYTYFKNKETDHNLIHSLKYQRCTLPGRLHR